ncbi:MAG: hypothetical protein M0Z46_20020 [Actinomycetota bacterium]|jgi:type IV pilus biogenesis protein CpaD/CtpE|nr:hypothetical protein [Actinomycetota bacterium]
MTLWALPAMVVVAVVVLAALLACLRPPRRTRPVRPQPSHLRLLPEREPYDQDAP